ncbi:MAG: hypothetical protein ACK5GN_12995 [Pseudomonadota bacterium]
MSGIGISKGATIGFGCPLSGVPPWPTVLEDKMGFGDSEVTQGFDSGFATSVIENILDNKAGYAEGPERALLSALLFDGVQSCVSFLIAQSEEERARYREAYNWVTTNDADYAFSFVCVCEALGINSEYLRLGLINATNSLLESVSKSRRNC